MDALNLDPGSYRGTYKLIGGRPSLDFVNTISWPGTGRAHDWLDSVDNLQLWLHAMDLQAVRGKRSDLQAATDLRAILTAVLRPLAHGERPIRKALDSLNQRIAQASARRIIDPSSLAWTWKPAKQAVHALAAVLLDAAELITADRHDRLRPCPSCDWLFEDQTRNGQRRWCDMADCGSRDKAKRYYQRVRQS